MKGFGDPETWGGQTPYEDGEWWVCHQCGDEICTEDDPPDDYICAECIQINSERELKEALREKQRRKKMDINSVSVFFEKEKNPKIGISKSKESVYPVSLTVQDADFGSATHFHFCSFDQIVSFKSQLDEGIRQTLTPEVEGDKVG